ncbi:hypothetical protein H4R34_000557 [Dimargaris verticillata]|uniref:mRNA capping enzyme adenylation domain-containing protein n=1 Tax=Dimargaris verticillata TaxID=2761393 RepID=A0A9W8B536_9FUNG|nr:hypothetical protein H4R34_000557 [Dimargaris verticillata]
MEHAEAAGTPGVSPTLTRKPPPYPASDPAMAGPTAPVRDSDHSPPGHIGVAVEASYQKYLQSRVRALLKVDHDRFPGAQPIVFKRDHFRLLENEDYYVSEKAIGTRYLMLIVHDGKKSSLFLADHLNNYTFIREIQIHQPEPEGKAKTLRETLIDGTLVEENDKDKARMRFLAFDVIAINSVIVTHRSYNSRLGMLNHDVLKPYFETLKRDHALARKQPFRIEIKRVERSYGVKLIFQGMTALRHKSDGLVFTPVRQPYAPGPAPKLLKWKPPEQCTAFFKIRVTYSRERKPIYQLLSSLNGSHHFLAHLQLEPELYQQWRSHPPDGRIAEFRYDPDWKIYVIEEGYAPVTKRGGWRFRRFCDDRHIADDEATIQDTLESVRNSVTWKEFESHLDQIRQRWKTREKGGVPSAPSSVSLAMSRQSSSAVPEDEAKPSVSSGDDRGNSEVVHIQVDNGPTLLPTASTDGARPALVSVRMGSPQRSPKQEPSEKTSPVPKTASPRHTSGLDRQTPPLSSPRILSPSHRPARLMSQSPSHSRGSSLSRMATAGDGSPGRGLATSQQRRHSNDTRPPPVQTMGTNGSSFGSPTEVSPQSMRKVSSLDTRMHLPRSSVISTKLSSIASDLATSSSKLSPPKSPADAPANGGRPAVTRVRTLPSAGPATKGKNAKHRPSSPAAQLPTAMDVDSTGSSKLFTAPPLPTSPVTNLPLGSHSTAASASPTVSVSTASTQPPTASAPLDPRYMPPEQPLTPGESRKRMSALDTSQFQSPTKLARTDVGPMPGSGAQESAPASASPLALSATPFQGAQSSTVIPSPPPTSNYPSAAQARLHSGVAVSYPGGSDPAHPKSPLRPPGNLVPQRPPPASLAQIQPQPQPSSSGMLMYGPDPALAPPGHSYRPYDLARPYDAPGRPFDAQPHPNFSRPPPLYVGQAPQGHPGPILQAPTRPGSGPPAHPFPRPHLHLQPGPFSSGPHSGRPQPSPGGPPMQNFPMAPRPGAFGSHPNSRRSSFSQQQPLPARPPPAFSYAPHSPRPVFSGPPTSMGHAPPLGGMRLGGPGFNEYPHGGLPSPQHPVRPPMIPRRGSGTFHRPMPNAPPPPLGGRSSSFSAAPPFRDPHLHNGSGGPPSHPLAFGRKQSTPNVHLAYPPRPPPPGTSHSGSRAHSLSTPSPMISMGQHAPPIHHPGFHPSGPASGYSGNGPPMPLHMPPGGRPGLLAAAPPPQRPLYAQQLSNYTLPSNQGDGYNTYSGIVPSSTGPLSSAPPAYPTEAQPSNPSPTSNDYGRPPPLASEDSKRASTKSDLNFIMNSSNDDGPRDDAMSWFQ